MGTSHYTNQVYFDSYTNETQHEYYLPTTTNNYGNYRSHSHHNPGHSADSLNHSPSYYRSRSPCPSHCRRYCSN